MSTTRVAVFVTVPTEALAEVYGPATDIDDLEASFAARLGEVYCGPNDEPVVFHVLGIDVEVEDENGDTARV